MCKVLSYMLKPETGPNDWFISDQHRHLLYFLFVTRIITGPTTFSSFAFVPMVRFKNFYSQIPILSIYLFSTTS